MEAACRQARAWELSGRNARVAINLSPSQLHSGDLAHTVAELLDATGLTPSLLELEVTEDILLLDERRVLDMFRRIQELCGRAGLFLRPADARRSASSAPPERTYAADSDR